MTVEQLKEHFQGYDDDFKEYYCWYYDSVKAAQRKRYREVVDYALILNNTTSIPFATDEEMDAAVQQVSEAIKETNAYELRKSDLDSIIKWLNENHEQN